MDKPNVFAPFVGPFRVDGRTIVDRNDDAAVMGNLATSESESGRVLRAICFRMNAPDEPRFTVEEILRWLHCPELNDKGRASDRLKDPTIGIAAFTARNKESRP